jgi:hypothetical protein
VSPRVATGVQERRAVQALRRARRRRARERFHWVDALYRAYLTGIGAIVATLFLSGALGDARATAAERHDIAVHAPALLGCLLAVLIAMGLRAGSRGGPLVIEAADVQHLLLAPIDRGIALSGTVMRQLRSRVFIAVVAGAVVGNLAFRRLPGRPGAWIASVAVFGLLAAAAGHAVAVNASGRRVRRSIATVAGSALVLWSVADVVLNVQTSPATWAGHLAVLPLRHGPADWAAAVAFAVVVVVLVLAALATVGGTSLELALRRAELTAVLRFAVTVGDLRAVVLLRRQLASELPRRTPWIRLPGGPTAYPVWRRSWQSFLRWPPVRIARVIAAGVVAGLAGAGSWHTTPLLAVTALALLVAAFDVTEPMAQEVDHPTLRDLHPVDARLLMRRHLAAPLVVMAGVCLVGVLAALAVAPPATVLPVGLATTITAAVAAVAAAVLSAGTDPFTWVTSPALNNARVAAPFVVAAIGVAPILAARAAERAHMSPGRGALGAVVVPLLLCAAVFAFTAAQIAPRRRSAT